MHFKIVPFPVRWDVFWGFTCTTDAAVTDAELVQTTENLHVAYGCVEIIVYESCR